ncbi:MAG: DUF3619 family protein [Burkholderiales bacterium]
MKRQDHELGTKIVRLLDSGTETLAPQVQKRLLEARKAALAHYREKPEPAWNLAWAGHIAARFGRHRIDMRQLIAIAALIAALIGVAYWQARTPVNDIAEIDLGLLTDDLPLNAYLDRDFDSWLKRSLH